MNVRVFSFPLSIVALLLWGCSSGQHAITPVPEPATQGFLASPAPPTFAEYKPPANGVTTGIAIGADHAVWFTQNNSYVGRFLNGAFSAVYVNVPQFNYMQNNALNILAANSSGVYGGVQYVEQSGFNDQNDIFEISYTHHVSLTSGQQISSPNTGTLQAISAGTSAAYATGSYDALGPPGCNDCLYVISSSGGDAVRTQNYEAGEAIANAGSYIYVAAAENYGNGTQHGIKLYELNASTLTSFTQVAVLAAPSNIHFMTLGPDGALWFTDNGRNAIGRYSSGTVHEYAVPTSNADPEGIVRGLDGALWFTEALSNKLGRITTTGTITEYKLPFTGGKPTGLAAVTTVRNLWYTDIGTGKLGRVIY